MGLWRSLGARFHGMEEVVGSIPTRSTNIPFKFIELDAYTPTGYRQVLVSIGVNFFQNHFVSCNREFVR